MPFIYLTKSTLLFLKIPKINTSILKMYSLQCTALRFAVNSLKVHKSEWHGLLSGDPGFYCRLCVFACTCWAGLRECVGCCHINECRCPSWAFDWDVWMRSDEDSFGRTGHLTCSCPKTNTETKQPFTPAAVVRGRKRGSTSPEVYRQISASSWKRLTVRARKAGEAEWVKDSLRKTLNVGAERCSIC